MKQSRSGKPYPLIILFQRLVLSIKHKTHNINFTIANKTKKMYISLVIDVSEISFQFVTRIIDFLPMLINATSAIRIATTLHLAFT